MSKGLEAITQLVQEEAKSDRPKSRLSFLKKNQSIRVRIPEDIIDNLHVYKVVEVFQKINQTLSYSAEGRSERDLYAEAHELMKQDHAAGKADGSIDPNDKDAYRESMILQPKPIILFGVIPLTDFTTQSAKPKTFEAGQPLLLQTNLGKDNANIDALTSALQKDTNVKKFKSRAFEITCVANNKYSFAVVDDEDLTADEKKVLEETAGVSIPDEVFDNALFESTTEKQLADLASIGFSISRLKGFESAGQETTDEPNDITSDDLPF